MKVKLIDLVNSIEPLNKLIQDECVPLSVGLKLYKPISDMNTHIEFHRTKSQSTVKKYGIPDEEDENKLTVPEEKREEFLKEMQALNDSEIDLDAEQITKDEQKEMVENKVKLTVQDLVNIKFLLE